MSNIQADPARPKSDQARAPRGWLLWIVIFGGIILLMLFRERRESQGEPIRQPLLEQLVENDQIVHAAVYYDLQSPLVEVAGTYSKLENGVTTNVPFRAKVRMTDRLERKLLSSPQIEVRTPNTTLMSVVWSVLPLLIIAALIWFFFIRQIKRSYKSGQDLQSKSLEQQTRFDRILDKWEEQTRRMDAVLDRMEQNNSRSQ